MQNNKCRYHSFWMDTEEVPNQFPWLSNNITCDVVVVGGGICGVMCALRFAQENMNCVLLEEETIGSRINSTGILSYNSGIGMKSFSEEFGIDNSVKFFKRCASSINEVEKMCETINQNVSFCRRDLFTFCQEKEQKEIETEYLMQLHNGFIIDLLHQKECEKKFSFPVSSGIYAHELGAEMNPFRFVYAMAQKAEELGTRIYEYTPIYKIVHTGSGCDIYCQNGNKVSCQKVIVLVDSFPKEENQEFPIVHDTNFTIITEPVQNFSGWYKQCILESVDDKSVTMRTTTDNRIMISGLNTIFFDAFCKFRPSLEIKNGVEQRRYKELYKKLQEFFPAIREIKLEYCYSIKRTEPKFGMPYIAIDRENKDCFYVLCGTTNSIVNSELVSRNLAAYLQNQEVSMIDFFEN